MLVERDQPLGPPFVAPNARGDQARAVTERAQ